MMKNVLFLVAFCFVFSGAFAQTERQTQNRKFVDVITGDLAYITQYTDVKGSPFLFDNWLPGKLILNNGETLQNLQLKFDDYNNKFLLNKNDTGYQISPVVKQVVLYPGTADTSTFLLFKSGFTGVDKLSPKTFVQVLVDGKNSLLKQYKKDLEEYTEYGNATRFKRFNESFEYFAGVNGKYITIRFSRKTLEELMQEKWTAVSAYLTQNKLNGKDEKSFIEAFKFYNKL